MTTDPIQHRAYTDACAFTLSRWRPDRRVGLEREDVETEVRLALWRAWERGKRRFSVLSDVGRAALIECLRAWGPRTRAGYSRLDCVPLEWADRLPGEDVSEAVARLIEGAKVRRAVSLLPQKMRVAMTRYHLEGKTWQEIGAELNVSNTRVYQLLREGRERLRVELGGGQ